MRMAEKFHTVGIGVSEGGQRGILEFLQHVPSEPDMAFVVIHDVAYKLDEIIKKFSLVRTVAIEHDTKVEKNHLYIAPRNVFVSVNNGHFNLEQIEEGSGTIDFFLTSLARDSGDLAVGVVLSRVGDAGLAGLAEIDKYGGTTLIQSRSSAPFAPGPLSIAALDAVHPTLVASPATLALYLTSFALFHEFGRPVGGYPTD